MSAADGLVRNEEDAGATPATLTICGRQADISWLHLSRKQDRREPRSERYRRLPPIINPQRKEYHENRRPLSRPIALSQELQTESCGALPSGTEAQDRFSPNATVRFEAETGTRPVAQKQSARPITGRRRSVTCQDDQPLLSELRLGEPIPRVAEGDLAPR